MAEYIYLNHKFDAPPKGYISKDQWNELSARMIPIFMAVTLKSEGVKMGKVLRGRLESVLNYTLKRLNLAIPVHKCKIQNHYAEYSYLWGSSLVLEICLKTANKDSRSYIVAHVIFSQIRN